MVLLAWPFHSNCSSFQVSLGTLLAYTTVAICVLILRYVPPDEVPFPLSYKEAIDSVSSRRAISNSPADICVEHPKVYSLNNPFLVRKETTSIRCPSINRDWNCKFVRLLLACSLFLMIILGDAYVSSACCSPREQKESAEYCWLGYYDHVHWHTYIHLCYFILEPLKVRGFCHSCQLLTWECASCSRFDPCTAVSLHMPAFSELHFVALVCFSFSRVS